eukprot:CAMPEP_0114542984 /NCGR_PEP_ID=MMETSP0114-20121206/2118_1 /TAXON_ID=31324 /ORGANISM="Goniomonas sp, Strain m" /LENGTH=306 /DNA_ID=CAMNT_0001727301 /DNA_START=97 /DNA_END=1014 /DNA_ORIENTATION=+
MGWSPAGPDDIVDTIRTDDHTISDEDCSISPISSLLSFSFPMVGLVDSQFANHPMSLGNSLLPSFFRWDRDSPEAHKVVVFTDMEYHMAKLAKFRDCYRIALGIEVQNSGQLDYLAKHSADFHRILTLNALSDLQHIPHARPYIYGVSWIPLQHWGLHRKNKMLSTIASPKAKTQGHQMRHQGIRLIRQLGTEIDAYGQGYTRLADKRLALQTYRYSLTIENVRTDYYFTEKLLDCFAMGVIPIYWGALRVGELFDLDGLITINSLDDLRAVLPTLSQEDYLRRLPAVQRNLRRALRFAVPEDNIW